MDNGLHTGPIGKEAFENLVKETGGFPWDEGITSMSRSELSAKFGRGSGCGMEDYDNHRRVMVICQGRPDVDYKVANNHHLPKLDLRHEK